jgi:predicted secreted protein
MRTALLSALAALTLAAPAFADDNGLALPPSGTTIINLSVTERTTLPQDTLNASLRLEQEGTSATDIQNNINKQMTNALAEAKKVTEVKTSTGGYYVYQYDAGTPDPKTGQILKSDKKWRGSQTIQLESKDSAKLLDLAGKIQSMGFVMDGLNYSLSNAQADSVRDDLMTKALKGIGDKAKIAQTALGKGSYDILDVNIDNASPPIYPMYKAMAMRAESAQADMAAPAAQAGETDVNLTVNARVLLKP